MSSTTAGRISVAPSAIEGELARIWRDTAALDQSQEKGQEKGAESSARVRTALSNIIIFSLGAKSSTIDNLITELLIAHPSRFFVIEFDVASQAERLETFLSSRCVLAHSGRHVCSEEIYIHTPVRAAELVPNLLLSLFRADVPATMVFPNGLQETSVSDSDHRHAFQELIRTVGKVSDKVVFDSKEATNYHLLITMLRTAIDSPDLSAEDADFRLLRDLHWRRLERWRNLIAEQFEASTGPDLATRIKTITLRGGWDIAAIARGMLPSDAFILGGWCAARLGFLPDTRRADANTAAAVEVSGLSPQIAGDGRMALRFEVDSAAPNNTLTEVKFMMRGADAQAAEACLQISRNPATKTGQVLWQEAGATAVPNTAAARQVPFTDRGIADLFIGEISTNQMYRLFEESVRSGESIRKCLLK